MLLRTRITSLAAGGLLLMALGLVAGGWWQRGFQQQRLAQAVRAAVAGQWNDALAMEDRISDEYIDKLLVPEFLQAVRHRDAAALRLALEQQGFTVGADAPVQVAQLLRVGGDPASVGAGAAASLLDPATLRRASEGDSINGLRLTDAGRALVLSTRRLPDRGDAPVLVLARDVGHAMRRMAQAARAAVTLLDARGRLVYATDAALWQEAAPRLAAQGPQYAELRLQGRHYRIGGVAVEDLSGRRAGTLLTLVDDTEEAATRDFATRLMLGSAALLVLLVLWVVYRSLRGSLRPLEESVAALHALAQGDTSMRLPYTGDDEVGRIARAVDAFRRNAQELAETRARHERLRREQESLMRDKLQALARATHQHVEFAAGLGDDEQLQQLAGVMNTLSGRLIEQHRRLSGMVQELREALVTKDRLAGLEQELRIAAQVQASILPRHAPQDARLALHCHITPAREVGGDFYDYFLIDADRLGFVMADVSGKGVPAALFMTITRTLLKATAQFIAEPTRCIEQVNRLLAAENEQMMFVTLFYGVLHLGSGRVDYVNAGHDAPCVLRGDGGVAPLARTGGVALAVVQGQAYRCASVQLRAGEGLFLYTDGLTEAFDPDGRVYGGPRLVQALGGAWCAARRSPQDLARAVLADVQVFERGAHQADDKTCMALLWLGGAGSPGQQ